MTSIYSEKHPLSAFFIKAAALLLMLAIASCAPRYTTHGHQIDPFELEQITIGTSSIQDVRDVLGQPSFTGAFNENKLFYVSQHMREPVAGKNETFEREIYIFSFDASDRLETIEIQDEKTGISVITLDAVTPTPGDGFGVVEQIFTNLRRRNQSGE